MSGRFLRNLDWLILLATVLLIAVGLLNLYSVGHVPEDLREMVAGRDILFFQRQLLWALLGFAAMAAAFSIPFRYYEGGAVVLYIATLLLLVAVLFLEPAKGSSRWIALGGFRVQPSELAKISLIFILARFLAEKRHDPNRLRIIIVAFGAVIVPVLLVMKQPDLGTALVFPALLLPILYWRGLDEGVMILFLTPVASAFLTVFSQSVLGEGKYPYPLLILFVAILAIAYRRRARLLQSIMLVATNLAVMLVIPTLIDRLKPYQQQRIFAFLRPESDILGSGWQVYQSKVAIGSGGFSGKGFLHGTQKLLAFLPERHSDFVFSVLSEEAGYLGALGVMMLFLVIIVRGLYLATKVKSRFASLAVIGICSYFAFHLLVNVGMTIGLAPVTGIPLPLISYGGSSMLVSCFLIGVLLNFSASFYEY
ncbi:MAG: rod shape-determining protein RodA [Candidatus Krumholzibacteria bacterium]|nr:rod shape-determining protein RodA [Candidatus Krumholzibacteria bacterium]